MTTKTKTRSLDFTLRRQRIHVILDKVLFLRFLRRLHGRFWGIAAIWIMIVGFSICFLIRPDLLTISTAISDFGTDVRTAPYFAGSVFFGAYGLWRWRNYLARTWKRTMPVTGLITLTVLGLYITALMPVSWKPVPYRLHLFGISLTGISMLATVVLDGLLSKTRKTDPDIWRYLRLISSSLIVAGGWITLGSIELLGLYDLALLGEIMIFAGYGLWVTIKTTRGEGSRSTLSRLLKNIVLID